MVAREAGAAGPILPPPAPVRRIPVIGYAQAGNDGYFDDAGFPVGNGWDELVCPHVDDKNAYALEVSGDSMEPVYRDGDIIIIGANIMSFRSGEVSAEEPEAEAGEEAEVEEFVPEQAPAAVRSSASLADAFAPRHRKNLVLVPVLAVVLICVAVAGIFFLNRLFNH